MFVLWREGVKPCLFVSDDLMLGQPLTSFVRCVGGGGYLTQSSNAFFRRIVLFLALVNLPSLAFFLKGAEQVATVSTMNFLIFFFRIYYESTSPFVLLILIYQKVGHCRPPFVYVSSQRGYSRHAGVYDLNRSDIRSQARDCVTALREEVWLLKIDLVVAKPLEDEVVKDDKVLRNQIMDIMRIHDLMKE